MVFKKILIISSLCVVANLRGVVHETVYEAESYALNQPAEIVQAFINGDAKVISGYFNTSVELIFSEKQGVYGKAQAEQILKNFFSDNAYANKKFTYKQLHSSPNRDNAQYHIGELHTGKGSYRVTIIMKNQRIHQLRIESND